jgi:hypothetical protein
MNMKLIDIVEIRTTSTSYLLVARKQKNIRQKLGGTGSNT